MCAQGLGRVVCLAVCTLHVSVWVEDTSSRKPAEALQSACLLPQLGAL